MNLEWAAWLVAQRFRIFPVWGIKDGACMCPAGPGCGAAGKHPMISSWISEATTDLAVVEEFWVQDLYFADCNIGIECTGWVVIDVDPRNGGHEAISLWSRAAADELQLPRTRTHITGGQGWHMIYRCPSGLDVRNGPWLRGVEIKTAGGLVVAPGSLHKSGRYYTVEDPAVEIAWLPPAFADRELRRAAEARRRDTPRIDPVALLDGVPDGVRNQTLFDACWQLRWEHGVDEAGATAVVLAAARSCTPAYPDQDARAVVERVYGYEDRGGLPGNNVLLLPGALEWARGAGGAVVGEEVAPPGLRYPLTDMGNAQRIADLGTELLRHVPGWGWVAWDSARWDRYTGDKVALDTAKDAVMRMAIEEGSADLPRRERQELDRWVKTSQSTARLHAAIGSASNLLFANVAEFDVEDWELNTRQGIVDLRTGEVRGHRGDLVTKVAGAAWDGSAQCPKWLAFLERVLPDPDVRGLMQRAAGYSLTGDTSAKVMFTLWGSGNNGKSVFLEVLRGVLGDYATTAQKSVFVERRGDAHLTDIASLAGVRMATFAEIKAGEKLNTDVVKQLTGGDQVAARFMRQDQFTFHPKVKLWLGTNHKPGITDFGEAMKDRLRLVPFVVRIPVEERIPRDEYVAELVASEGPGILRWAFMGLEAHLADRWLGETVDMAAAKESWLDDEDVLGMFIREALVPSGSVRTSTARVVQAYRFWCIGQGLDHPVSGPVLGRELAARGFSRYQTQSERGFYLEILAERDAHL